LCFLGIREKIRKSLRQCCFLCDPHKIIFGLGLTPPLQHKYKQLTPREREVFALVTAGLLNKQVAYKLGATERTIKAHRCQVMDKLETEPLAHLVRIADRLGIETISREQREELSGRRPPSAVER
jgi:DNA-binding NarL/FixJ family response regulator